jgi:hypothetical protein
VRILLIVGCACALLGVGAASAGANHAAKVLRGSFPSNEVFVVNGVPKLFRFNCDEHRVQFPDGRARDTAHCRLLPGETPPSTAAHEYEPAGYLSDFAVFHAPGLAGGIVTFTSWTGVVTPSGVVNMRASFAAPNG